MEFFSDEKKTIRPLACCLKKRVSLVIFLEAQIQVISVGALNLGIFNISTF